MADGAAAVDLIPMPSSLRMTVRTARPDDVPTIVSFSAAMALETEGRRLDYDRLLEGTRAMLASPERGFFLVVEGDQGRLIGQLMITFEWSDWRNAVFWWIQSVYVAPAWRRQGVYRLLHETVVARAKADPTVCGIRLYVEQDNGEARTVYRKVGLSPSRYTVYEQDFVLGRVHHPTKDQE